MSARRQGTAGSLGLFRGNTKGRHRVPLIALFVLGFVGVEHAKISNVFVIDVNLQSPKVCNFT